MSVLTDTYPHKKPEEGLNGNLQSPGWQPTLCGLMSDLVLCELKEYTMLCLTPNVHPNYSLQNYSSCQESCFILVENSELQYMQLVITHRKLEVNFLCIYFTELFCKDFSLLERSRPTIHSDNEEKSLRNCSVAYINAEKFTSKFCVIKLLVVHSTVCMIPEDLWAIYG